MGNSMKTLQLDTSKQSNMDINKKNKTIKKTEYIVPYQDNGIGNKINLKVIGAIWFIVLLLKIICQDEEWGFFLMFSALLLLFILPFFITMEVDEIEIIEAEEQKVVTDVIARTETSSTTLKLPTPPSSTSSDSSSTPESSEKGEIPFIKIEAIEHQELTAAEPESKPGKQKSKKKSKKEKRRNLLAGKKTESPDHTLLYKKEESSDTSSSSSTSSFSIVGKIKEAKHSLFAAEVEGTSSDDTSSSISSSSEKIKKKRSRRKRSRSTVHKKKMNPKFMLLAKEDEEESSDSEKRSAQRAVKKEKRQRSVESIDVKGEAEYTLFRKDTDGDKADPITTVVVEEEIFKSEGEEQERTVEARLEIKKVPSENPDDDMFMYDLLIDVDPDTKDSMEVEVQGEVEGKHMDVHATAEGEGVADIRAGIQVGAEKATGEVELSVSDSTTSEDMELIANGNTKIKRKKSSKKGKKT